MTETYTRFKDGKYTTVPRYRFGVVDHITAYVSDPDELRETVYSFGIKAFSDFIRYRLSISVIEKTQTLANEAAMKFLRESGLFNFEKNKFYGYKYGSFQIKQSFDDLLEEQGRGEGAFQSPNHPNTIDLIWDDREVISLEKVKQYILKF